MRLKLIHYRLVSRRHAGGPIPPDWAILKHGDETLYLVRETKGTKDFLKLRTSESDKVRCGERHFEVLGVPFGVAVTADQV